VMYKFHLRLLPAGGPEFPGRPSPFPAGIVQSVAQGPTRPPSRQWVSDMARVCVTLGLALWSSSSLTSSGVAHCARPQWEWRYTPLVGMALCSDWPAVQQRLHGLGAPSEKRPVPAAESLVIARLQVGACSAGAGGSHPSAARSTAVCHRGVLPSAVGGFTLAPACNNRSRTRGTRPAIPDELGLRKARSSGVPPQAIGRYWIRPGFQQNLRPRIPQQSRAARCKGSLHRVRRRFEVGPESQPTASNAPIAPLATAM
jgi:hypothetical protein